MSEVMFHTIEQARSITDLMTAYPGKAKVEGISDSTTLSVTVRGITSRGYQFLISTDGDTVELRNGRFLPWKVHGSRLPAFRQEGR